ncbi:hypothetical protein RB195_008059 [Necator americanus]|uniref:RRM domain-containing protein n=1 Tax=Necator americanus TaxID=51031 RepID=A0ABR1C3X7_NECAM
MTATNPGTIAGMAAVASTVPGQPYATAPPQLIPTAAGIQTMYSEQRPTFSADGSGIPYSSVMNVPGPSALNLDISYDTNSKDPVLIKSRIFIGRLANAPVTRDDLITLFKPFGTILALNHFKQGYAFVQFSQPSEADAAVSGLNGKKWMGVIIDVHHVDGPTQGKKRTEQESRKRGADEVETQASKLLRATEIAPLEEIKQQNRANRAVALGDSTVNEDLFTTEIADTLICGSCRYVTADFEAFKNHRIVGCDKKKEEGEPTSFKCASCDSRFTSAWAILCHLTEFHRMMLYKEEEKEQSKDQEKANNEQSKRLATEGQHSLSTRDYSPMKTSDSANAGTPKQASGTPSQSTHQQQQQQMRHQPSVDPRSGNSVPSSSFVYPQLGASQSVYAQYASSQPVYMPTQTAQLQSFPALGRPFATHSGPESLQDSIITGSPVHYSNGASSKECLNYFLQ